MSDPVRNPPSRRDEAVDLLRDEPLVPRAPSLLDLLLARAAAALLHDAPVGRSERGVPEERTRLGAPAGRARATPARLASELLVQPRSSRGSARAAGTRAPRSRSRTRARRRGARSRSRAGAAAMRRRLRGRMPRERRFRGRARARARGSARSWRRPGRRPVHTARGARRGRPTRGSRAPRPRARSGAARPPEGRIPSRPRRRTRFRRAPARAMPAAEASQ